VNFAQNAQWIGDRQRAITGEPPCPFLRHQFFLTTPVKRATLHWAALGVADMHLNGEKVGKGFLMPGWSDFHRRVQVISHDVSKLLNPGANMLGAILGDGWYSGTLEGNNQRNHWGTHPQLLAWLDVELLDGKAVKVVTNGQWQMRYGPIFFRIFTTVKPTMRGEKFPPGMLPLPREQKNGDRWMFFQPTMGNSSQK